MLFPRNRTWIGSRATALLVFVCLLVQQAATPVHLLAEEHCRVIDAAAPVAGAGACRHAVEHHAHHEDTDGACAHPTYDADGCDHGAAATAPDDRASDCPSGHCPHPVTEHLSDWVAVVKRERVGTVAPIGALAVAASPPAEDAPDRFERIAPRPVRPPPRDLSFTPSAPRAPPSV
jgi:hypothetical protein